MGESKLLTQEMLGDFSLSKVTNWLDGYLNWLNTYTRDEQPCIINSDNLAANNFHYEVGRNGYVATESGSSEAQFITIRACAMAYLVTNNINWLNKAVSMANAALKVLFRDEEIPESFAENNVWLPHWLFDVKGDFTAEKYYLDYQVHFENGTATFDSDYEARTVFSVRATDATLQWENPYAEIIGTSYEIDSFTADGNTFTVNLKTPYTGDALVVYADFGGPTISKDDVYEAWPIWRKLEDTEIDCAVDSIWWAYDSFKLLSQITGNSKFTAAVNYLKKAIPYVIQVNNSNDYLTTDTTTNPYSTSGSYLYQDRNPAATISRKNGMINLDIPAGSGSAELGRCGLKSTWNSDDMAIEIKLRSNLANRIKFHIDPQADYDENTRWTSFIDVKGTGSSETFTLHHEDFVRLNNLIWSMEYLTNSQEQSYASDHSSVDISSLQDESGRKARHIELSRGTETGTTTIDTTDADGNPTTQEITYTYKGWAQYGIIWDKNAIPLDSIPNFHYKASGDISITIQDSDGWYWRTALPSTSSFTDYTPDISDFSTDGYQENGGNAPSEPAFPISAIILEAVDDECSVDLAWIGQLETMALNENIAQIVLDIFSSEAQNLYLEHIRPLPLPNTKYMPYVAPFTVNILEGQILDWRGSPYSGYQAPYIWQELGDAEGVATVLQFMKDAQDAYEEKLGVRGPFAPVYLWDRDDSKTYGTANTWTWNGPDPNTFWGGYQYRGAETVARAWYNDPQNSTAEKITMDFLNWINNSWSSYTSPIINEFLETKLPDSSGEDPHNAALLLRTAIYAYLSGGDETVTLGLITRCLKYLDRLYVPTNDSSLVGGTWSSYPEGNVWYSFVGGEIVNALSLLLKTVGVYGVGGDSDDILPTIKEIYNIADDYYRGELDSYRINRAVLNFFRFYRYANTITWYGTLGDTDSDFVYYLEDNYPDDFNIIEPCVQSGYSVYINGKETELAHLAATTLGYYSSPLIPDFWIGWGGDLATAMCDVSKLISEGSSETVQELAIDVIGSADYTCSKLDIENDIDAIKLASMLKSDSIGNLLDNYFQTVDGSSRRDILLDNLGFDYTPTVDELNTVIYNWMTGSYGFANTFEGWSLKRLATQRNGITFDLTDEVIQAVTLAFSEYILDLPNK